jgi:hypothetical protein
MLPLGNEHRPEYLRNKISDSATLGAEAAVNCPPLSCGCSKSICTYLFRQYCYLTSHYIAGV